MLKTFAQLTELLQPFRRDFMVYLLIVSVYEAAQVANSYALTAAIRLYQNNVDPVIWILFFAGIVVFDQLFRLNDHFLDWRVAAKLLFPITKHVKMLVLKVFLLQDSAWHQKNNSGVLIGKAENGTQKVQEMTDMLAWEFIPATMQSLLTVPPLLYYSPWVCCIVVCSLILFMVITRYAEKFRLPLRKQRHDLYETLWQNTEEAVKAHETVSIYGQTNRIIREQETVNDRIIELGTKEARTTIFRYHALRVSANQLTSRLIMGLLVWQLYTKQITIAEVFFIYMLSERLLSTFWRFARMMQRVGECSEGIHRLYNLSKQQPSITDGPETRHDLEIPEQLSVEFQHVTFTYPGHTKEVVRGLSMVINDGEEVAVVGPSGSGKTTLRRLLLRLFEITNGEIYIGGLPIRQWPLEKLRSLFAYVPQGDEVFIFDNDIEYNIRFARPDASFEEVERAARQAGLKSFIDSLPEGFATPVGEKGMKLSGGQKQRMALARAILSGRRFLILDEATSSVDALTEQEIQHELKEVLSGITSIIIAHRLQTVWGADKIVVLNNGSKETEGTHEDLMANHGGIYHKMVSLQTTYQTS